MNRIDRVTAILIQLQSRKIVKAQDIAERFNISLRTVYRDINTLEEAGVPVIGESGIGYSIMEGYRLPPVMFTREEATAFLTAGKLLEKQADNSSQESYRSAMYKVRAVLRSSEKDLLENIEENIQVLQRNTPFTDASPANILQPLLRAIADKRIMHIKYHTPEADECTTRDIETVGVYYNSEYWYLIAYCHLRKDYRTFRADRILQVQSTDKNFDGNHPSLKSFTDRLANRENLQKIVISVPKKTARYLENSKFYYGFAGQQPVKDNFEMTFLTPQPNVFIRWYTMYADMATIISPSTLKQQLKDHITSLAQKIS
jgi:predicted DNA-binding transcriptional regulator YafY